jgi:general secretion pathway protein K
MPTRIKKLPLISLLKGSALISALFIMTLVAIAATAMSTRLQLDIYRTRLTIQSDKLYLASEAITFWAMSELSNPKKQFTKSNIGGLVREFPKQFQSISPNLQSQGRLYDLQGRFNLNNLNDKTYYPVFLKLLEHILPDVNAQERTNIAIATRQWISPYVPGRGNDELVSYYLKQKPPYYPSQQPMQNISEFRLIRGVSAKIYQSLSEYVTVLPEKTAINLNTASKQLIMSLGNGLTESQAGEIIQARGKKGIIDKKDMADLLEKLNLRDEQLTLESQYFMSMAVIKDNDLTFANYSIINRNKDKNGKISISLISVSLNSK